MNPIQFFSKKIVLLKSKKRQIRKSPERDQAKEKSDFEERNRLLAYQMEREAKRILNGHF